MLKNRVSCDTLCKIMGHELRFNLIREVSRFLGGGKICLSWQEYKFMPKCHERGDKVISKYRSGLRISALTKERKIV